MAIICKLQIFGLIHEEPDHAGYKRFTLTNRALAVAELLRITNFRQSLEELKPPPPHDVLGIRPGTLITEVMAAYKRKRASYDPKKILELEPDVRALAELHICDIDNAYNQLLGS